MSHTGTPGVRGPLVALGGMTLQSPTAGDQPAALAPPSQDRSGAAKTRANLVTASPLGCQRDPRDPSVPGRKWRCRGSNTTPSSELSSSRWTLTRRISRIIAGAVHRFPATRRVSYREPPRCATGSAPATSYETGTTAQRLSLTGFAHSSQARIRTSSLRIQNPACFQLHHLGTPGARLPVRRAPLLSPLPVSRSLPTTLSYDTLCRISSVPYLPRAAGLPLRSILVFRGNRLRRECS